MYLNDTLNFDIVMAIENRETWYYYIITTIIAFSTST